MPDEVNVITPSTGDMLLTLPNRGHIQKETRDEPRDEADPEKAALLNRRSLLAGTAGMVSAIVMRSVSESAEAVHAGCAG